MTCVHEDFRLLRSHQQATAHERTCSTYCGLARSLPRRRYQQCVTSPIEGSSPASIEVVFPQDITPLWTTCACRGRNRASGDVPPNSNQVREEVHPTKRREVVLSAAPRGKRSVAVLHVNVAWSIMHTGCD